MIGDGFDRYYSHGHQLSCLTGAKYDDWMPYRGLRWLGQRTPWFKEHDTDMRGTISFGQKMFTPANISNSQLQNDDRPWAGWAYLGFGFVADHRSLKRTFNSSSFLDTLELQIGMVGEVSQVDHIQTWIHENVTSSPEPKGWRHQLHNEPGVVLSYRRQWQHIDSSRYFDILPSMGFSVGNVYDHLTAGLVLRVGSGLDRDYGPPSIPPGPPGSGFFRPKKDGLRCLGLGSAFDCYVFSGVEGRAVGRNIFLDGNTFVSSHSVKKEPLLGEAMVGFVFSGERWRASLTKVFRSIEFQSQPRPSSFGIINFTWHY
ncbi:MAG: lipid A deacylase LpxR family protein [Magnetococcales bacterium]|nr:lipid A deacylase LpxR family protein [Magnetococcales bacterium]